MNSEESRISIISSLRVKAVLKQKIYDNTNTVFIKLKKTLAAISREINSELEDSDKRVRMEYKERGKFDIGLKIAGDLLIFSMHSNIFEFDRSHSIWKSPYVQKDKSNSYCGIIHIYNFLADSFKYSRMEDLGYLIGRIFINHENQYFVEGKRQMSKLISNFGNEEITRDSIKQILYTAIHYALEFDLLVPPYDAVKIASVGQLVSKIKSSKIVTGKRMGFQFNSDDILQE